MKKPGFIDIHCHILPGVDDGAKDLEMSMKMAECSYKDGVRHIIATPHYPDEYGSAETLRSVFCEFQAAVRGKFPEMEVSLGNELFADHNTIKMLKEGRALTLCGTRYILIEFLPIVPLSDIVNAVYSITTNGYTPIIAHAERYEAFENIQNVRRVADMGAKLQVNASALVSKKANIKHLVKKWLKERLIDYIASDSHNTGSRSTKLTEAYKFAEKVSGTYYANKLFYGNADKMLSGDDDNGDMFEI